MKKFARHKTHDEIRDQCARQGVLFDDYRYRRHGDDSVVIGDLAHKMKGYVIYNTFNGRFFGLTPCGPTVPEWPYGTQFDSSDEKFDGQPWFDALLIFFYTER